MDEIQAAVGGFLRYMEGYGPFRLCLSLPVSCPAVPDAHICVFHRLSGAQLLLSTAED